MKLGLMTDGLAHLSRADCLDQVASWGLEAVEFGLGGWSSAPHVDLDALLRSAAERRRLLDEVADRGLLISALNASGNQLHPGPSGAADSAKVDATVELAVLLGVRRVVLMSGLPGAPGDTYPNWITTSWPPETLEVLEWQWRERLVPYWRELTVRAHRAGVLLCIEQHGRQCVHNTETFLRLREAVAAEVGEAAAEVLRVNFDPSHLLWMGGEPVEAIRALGGSIGHVHAKDTRLEEKHRRDGLLDANPNVPVEARAWNYVSVGRGRSAAEWARVLGALRDVGYDDVLSIENEDHS
ncbi:MAG TPA: sugar phosphate isomerase/epimerase, partial [Trueperaceae bacterium]